MAEFKPSLPYNTPLELLTPNLRDGKGVLKNITSCRRGKLNCNFKTYGGTESKTAGSIPVLDTANVETWYRPDIQKRLPIKVLQSGTVWQIIGEPENVSMRGRYPKMESAERERWRMMAKKLKIVFDFIALEEYAEKRDKIGGAYPRKQQRMPWKNCHGYYNHQRYKAIYANTGEQEKQKRHP